LLLASEPTGWLDPQDRDRQAAFQKQRRSQEQLAQKLVPKLPQEGNLSEILQREPQAELALAILHQQQKLIWVDPFHYRLTDNAFLLGGESVAPSVSIEAYLSAKSCRWQFLLRAFGFDREAQGTACGHCDRCS
jgi:ATP-dependent DNA helicase RecQ